VPGLRPDDALYEKKVADVDHIVGHRLAVRDVFVTDDGGVLKRAAALETQCAVRVMAPSQALELIERSVNRALVVEDFGNAFDRLSRLVVAHLGRSAWTPDEQAA